MRNKNQSDLLIVFMKNPIIGQVKSRLARDTGEMAAYHIYLDLLSRIQQTTSAFEGDKSVFYANSIDKEDNWPNDQFDKFLQKGDNIGECMNNSINTGINLGHEKVVLIGSDIPNLGLSIINSAFQMLNDVDVVLGPSTDGGYYLIGLKNNLPDLFEEIPWSTNNVLRTTLSKCKAHNLTTSLLPELTDLDTVNDIYLLNEDLRDHFLQIIEQTTANKMPV